jgi:Major Facilitator Superfamily
MSTKNFQILNLYVNRFLGDFIPVAPLLGILLLNKNFDLSDISLFFLFLSLTVMVMEIPAGIFADSKSTKLVIVFSRVFKLLAFSTLLFVDSIFFLCLTAVLWGLASALDSGAIQAYTFQLTRALDLEDRFESVYSRTFTAALLGLLFAGLVASQINLLGLIFVQYIGIASLLLCVLSALLFTKFEHPPKIESTTMTRSMFSSITLSNLSPILLMLLCVGMLAGGLKGSLDEYTTLLLNDKHLSISLIGYIMFGLELLKTTGAIVAEKFKVNSKRQIYILFMLGSAFLLSAIGGQVMVVISLVFILFTDAILWVHNDTAIQRLALDSNRATLASFKSFGTELISGSVFVIVWLFGSGFDVSLVYFICGAITMICSFLLFVYHTKLSIRG